MDQLDRFVLQGTTYYQQYRKCNKPTCKCADGQLHGPYFFSRAWHGKVKYIGKNLPPEVAAVRVNHDALLTEMVAKRRGLINQADALARLIGNKPLTAQDQEILEDLGFGLALLPAAAPAVAKDEKQLSLV